MSNLTRTVAGQVLSFIQLPRVFTSLNSDLPSGSIKLPNGESAFWRLTRNLGAMKERKMNVGETARELAIAFKALVNSDQFLNHYGIQKAPELMNEGNTITMFRHLLSLVNNRVEYATMTSSKAAGGLVETVTMSMGNSVSFVATRGGTAGSNLNARAQQGKLRGQLILNSINEKEVPFDFVLTSPYISLDERMSKDNLTNELLAKIRKNMGLIVNKPKLSFQDGNFASYVTRGLEALVEKNGKDRNKKKMALMEKQQKTPAASPVSTDNAGATPAVWKIQNSSISGGALAIPVKEVSAEEFKRDFPAPVGSMNAHGISEAVKTAKAGTIERNAPGGDKSWMKESFESKTEKSDIAEKINRLANGTNVNHAEYGNIGTILSSVTMKVGGDIIRFDVSNYPLTQFVEAGQDQTRHLQLNFSTTAAIINDKTTQFNGKPLAGPTAYQWKTGLSVALAFSVHGDIDLLKSGPDLTASPVSVSAFWDNAGVQLDINDLAYASIKVMLENAEIIGMEVETPKVTSDKVVYGNDLKTVVGLTDGSVGSRFSEGAIDLRAETTDLVKAIANTAAIKLDFDRVFDASGKEVTGDVEVEYGKGDPQASNVVAEEAPFVVSEQMVDSTDPQFDAIKSDEKTEEVKGVLATAATQTLLAVAARSGSVAFDGELAVDPLQESFDKVVAQPETGLAEALGYVSKGDDLAGEQVAV